MRRKRISPQDRARMRAVVHELEALAPVFVTLLEESEAPARPRRVVPPDEPVSDTDRAAARAALERLRAAGGPR